MTTEQEQDLWRRVRDRGDQEAVNMLAVEYFPLTRWLARRFASRYQIERDAAFSAALLGLAEAIRRFDADREVKFMSYARPIIIGRMRDELRSLDHVSRYYREAERKAQMAASEMAHQLGHWPTDDELHAAGVEPCQVPQLTPLDTVVQENNRPLRIEHLVYARPEGEAEESVARFGEIRGLNKRERYILIAKFVCGLRYREIARRLRVSEDLVRRILLAVLARLRDRGERTREELTS